MSVTTTISSPIVPPPQQFSSTNGSIQGAINGVNTVYTLGAMVKRAKIFRNGLLQTLNYDCVFSGQTIVFLSINLPPQTGDVITALAW